MERIMIGDVQRLNEFVGTETCPLQHKVTEYTAPRADMWLYTLKVWMEKENITVKWNVDRTEERGIMDACTKKQDRRDIWKWVRQTGCTKIRDLLYPDGDWREDTPDGRDLALSKKTVFFSIISRLFFTITFSVICIVFMICFFQSFSKTKNSQKGGNKAFFFQFKKTENFNE